MVHNTYTSSLKLSLFFFFIFSFFLSILLGFGFFSPFVSLPFLFHLFYLLSQYILASLTLDSHFSFFSIKLDIFSLDKLSFIFFVLPHYLQQR